MTTGLCTSTVIFTAEQIDWLNLLPDAVNEAEEADGCIYLAGHPGPHACRVQCQDLSDEENSVVWWAVWEGPDQPDNRADRIVAIAECDAVREDGDPLMDDCVYPAGHEAPHRWWR